jgi:hypothetical protein
MSVVRTFSGPWLRANAPLCVLLLLPVELCLATMKLYLPATAVSDRMTASSRRKFLSGCARITHSIPAGGDTVISIVCLSRTFAAYVMQTLIQAQPCRFLTLRHARWLFNRNI